MPEARESGAPGILIPRRWGKERKSRRTGLGGEREDGPIIANSVLGSERPQNKPLRKPVSKRRHLTSLKYHSLYT